MEPHENAILHNSEKLQNLPVYDGPNKALGSRNSSIGREAKGEKHKCKKIIMNLDKEAQLSVMSFVNNLIQTSYFSLNAMVKSASKEANSSSSSKLDNGRTKRKICTPLLPLSYI